MTGVLGILLSAQKAGQLASVAAVIDALREKAGFRLADSLVRSILVESGESE
ncbi:MAG: DUF3368 domain-containing protein [Anaerolineae bacterium]